MLQYMLMYMEHERSLWERVRSTQEKMSREDWENQRLFFGLLLSRLRGPAPHHRNLHMPCTSTESQYEQSSFYVSLNQLIEEL